MAEASQLFSQKANDYRSGRTHYPKAIASILRELELPGNKAVDAGCGTGIFSQLLLDCGFFVYGVEPNAEMLCAAKEQLHCSQFVPIQSTAEAIPLPDHSVDFICAAQSFHWFDRRLSALLQPPAPAGRKNRSYLEHQRPSPSPDAGLSDNLPFAVRAIPRLSQRAGPNRSRRHRFLSSCPSDTPPAKSADTLPGTVFSLVPFFLLFAQTWGACLQRLSALCRGSV